MHTRNPIGFVRIALRLSLAAAFLSAVADRFGWWKPFGQGSWGSMDAFADYAHQLVPFATGWLLTVIVWAATATEATLGVLLLTGWRPKLSAPRLAWCSWCSEPPWLYPSEWSHRLATAFSPQQARQRPTRYLVLHRRHTPLRLHIRRTQL
jgi:hypothetical protein